MDDYGHIQYKLDELIKERKLSKAVVCLKANLQRTRLNAYCRGEIQRPDIDVLARLCYALDCQLSDIMVYVPRDTEENK